VGRVNPYQPLLYGRAWEHGIAPLPLADLKELDALATLRQMGAQVVLHHHWTNLVLADAGNDRDGRAAVDEFLARIDRFLDAGGQLVWTVHNVVPHETTMPEREAELRRGIVARALFVHIIAEQTPELVADLFVIPKEKAFHVPHPNYIGVYADYVDRDEARHQLGLWPDELVYAFVGQIRPYKGLVELVDAFDAITASDPHRRLLVAGLPGKGPAVDAFLERCLLQPFISLHPRRIPTDEMQMFLRSADVAVLPYVRALSSGVLMLALSFGLPVVVPRMGGITELVTDEFARTFSPGDPDSLIAAIRAADELRTPEARGAALEMARRYDPGALSERFAGGLAERIRRARPAVPVA
jgi:beta-1,4-mannosyltransferase